MKAKPEKVQHLSHYLDDQYPIYRILSSPLFGYFYYNQFSFSSFKFYIGRDLMRDFSIDSFKFRLNLVLGQVISSYLNYWLVFMNSHFTGFYKMGALNWFMIDSSLYKLMKRPRNCFQTQASLLWKVSVSGYKDDHTSKNEFW